MRPIDANALRVEISSLSVIITALRNGKGTLFEYMEHYRDSVLRIIDEAPTLDVAPVVHGRWIDKQIHRRMQSRCSACGKHSGIGGIESNRHKPFCPNCGAKMDKEWYTDD